MRRARNDDIAAAAERRLELLRQELGIEPPDDRPDDRPDEAAAILKRVLLRNGEVPNVTQFAQARFAPGQVAGAHAHADMAEVFLVEAGSGTIVVDDVAHPLRPGTCVAVLRDGVVAKELTGDDLDQAIISQWSYS